MVLSMDRVLVLGNATESEQRARVVVPVIWIVSFINVLAVSVRTKLAIYFTATRVIGCRRPVLSMLLQDNLLVRRIANGYLIVSCHPALFVIIVTNLRIWLRLRSQRAKLPAGATLQDIEFGKRQQSLTRMLLAIV